MKIIPRRKWCLPAILIPLFLLASGVHAGLVYQVTVDAPIHPVSMTYIQNAIELAEESGADALLIQLDTPGGLMESTRGITKAILNSKIPVIVYVAPEGARAGSAGVFITMAAHVAAMAPSTNIGAATPVSIGGGKDEETGEKERESPKEEEKSDDWKDKLLSDSDAMRAKITNDAVAQVRAMAERRGRNADWAEKAVREAASITANQALEERVVDLIAVSVKDLLQQADGRIVIIGEDEVTLNTSDSRVEHIDLTWREKFLFTLVNPNLAYILMLLGFYGLIFELYNPGAIIPGVVGVISLILAFFAFQTLPLNWAGLLLILVSFVMFLLEVKVPSMGMLTLGGVISLALGSIMLIDTTIPALKVSWTVIVPTLIFTALFFIFALTMGIRAQKNKVITGPEGLVGETGEVFDTLNPKGRIRVGGEYWKAEAEEPPIQPGEQVLVTGVRSAQAGGSRLILKVRRQT